MGRGKIEIKRIENSSSRRVTYSKRKNRKSSLNLLMSNLVKSMNLLSLLMPDYTVIELVMC